MTSFSSFADLQSACIDLPDADENCGDRSDQP